MLLNATFYAVHAGINNEVYPLPNHFLLYG